MSLKYNKQKMFLVDFLIEKCINKKSKILKTHKKNYHLTVAKRIIKTLLYKNSC